MTRESELQLIADALPAAAVRLSRDRRFLWVNACYARWLARPAGQIVGRRMDEVVGREAAREIEPYLERVLRGEQVTYQRLARFPGLGERRTSWTLAPMQDGGWVGVGSDIHENQRKDEFLAALAHELRNPLAPMRNAVAILARKGSQDPEVAWSQSVIERQIEQLSRLIGDLVDIERIARGNLALRKERVTLEAVVDMALETSRPHVTAGGHRLSVLMPSERAQLDADPARLAQAIGTLLRNAAKHTPPQGEITLSAAVEGREVVVSVEDSGAGLEPEAARRIFAEGAGVGLRLVHGVITLHGGRIEVRSAGAGRGSEFIVRLPLASGAAAQERVPAVNRDAPLRPVRVLVADDNRDAADTLQRLLALYGHEVRVAYDGDSAMRIGREFRPRVAVLDIAMPGTDGYEVAREMRKQQGRNVTIVALTGWGQEADRRRAMESGFDHHLVKPVDPGALNDLLAGISAKK